MRSISLIYIFILLVTITTQSIAGSNKLPGCAIDLDITTKSYESGVSSIDIENNRVFYTNDSIYIAIIAQNVSNLDTYQAALHYDDSKLEFIGGFEDIPIFGVINILKQNAGNTLGFQAVKLNNGVITLANSLIGNNISDAPEGSGVIGVIGFKILSKGECSLKLDNVYFVDSLGNKEKVINLNNSKLIIK